MKASSHQRNVSQVTIYPRHIIVIPSLWPRIQDEASKQKSASNCLTTALVSSKTLF
jgi:hypothetical protein